MTKPAIKEHQTSTVLSLSHKWGVEPERLLPVVKASIFKGEASKVSDEDLIAFLLVANKYDLNPFLREIYAFPGRQGGIVPIVGLDGWVNLVNRNSRYNGVEFLDHTDAKGELGAVTCRMFVKDMERPVEVTEYMAECRRDTEPWKKWPRRMLRHKAYIQGARIAFGLSGIYDEDEAARIIEAEDATMIREPLSVEQAKKVLVLPCPPEQTSEPPEIPEDGPEWREKFKAQITKLSEQFDPKREAYMRVLGSHGFENSDQVPDKPTALKIYKDYGAAIDKKGQGKLV